MSVDNDKVFERIVGACPRTFQSLVVPRVQQRLRFTRYLRDHRVICASMRTPMMRCPWSATQRFSYALSRIRTSKKRGFIFVFPRNRCWGSWGPSMVVAGKHKSRRVLPVGKRERDVQVSIFGACVGEEREHGPLYNHGGGSRPYMKPWVCTVFPHAGWSRLLRILRKTRYPLKLLGACDGDRPQRRPPKVRGWTRANDTALAHHWKHLPVLPDGVGQ